MIEKIQAVQSIQGLGVENRDGMMFIHQTDGDCHACFLACSICFAIILARRSYSHSSYLKAVSPWPTLVCNRCTPRRASWRRGPCIADPSRRGTVYIDPRNEETTRLHSATSYRFLLFFFRLSTFRTALLAPALTPPYTAPFKALIPKGFSIDKRRSNSPPLSVLRLIGCGQFRTLVELRVTMGRRPFL